MAEPGRGRLTRAQTIGYAAGSLLDGTVNNALNLFLLFYVTVVCGLPGTLAGLALGIAQVVDAIADPLIGAASDRWRSRLGRRLPFMLVGLPVNMIAFVALFSLPAGLGRIEVFVAVLVLATLLRLAYSVFNLPYFALGAELVDDHAARARLGAWRWGFAMLAGLFLIVAGFGHFFAGEGGLARRDGYPPFAWSAAAVMAAGAIPAILVCLALRDRVRPTDAAPGGSPAAAIREVFASASFRVIFASTLLLFVGQGVALSIGLHANSFFWRLGPAETQKVMLALFGGLLVGAPLLAPVAARVERRTLLVAALTVLMVAQSTPVALALAGVQVRPLPLLAGAMFVVGVAFAAATIAVTAMLGDAADEHELRFGTRRAALYFAGWAFAAKSASGIGNLVSDSFLDLAGFPATLPPGVHPALAPHTVTAIGIASGPGAAIFSVAAIAVLLRYRLDRRRHATVLAGLRERAGAA